MAQARARPPAGPGLIALLGSGETAPSGGAVFEAVARRLASPLRVAILETPAGFQPNSAQVARKVAAFVATRLGNYRPSVAVVPARRRGTPDSPDDPEVTAALSEAGLIFLGPGSPTYAVRQLRASLAWQRIVGRHSAGAAVVAASAATIALGACALPVYEIFKAGDELHWTPGLDLFGRYGLSWALVPHWNNREGGAELDTSRCYMGAERFERLVKLLPPDVTVVGIDEHTALVLDLAAGIADVLGLGGVTVLRKAERRLEHGARVDLEQLGVTPVLPPRAPLAATAPAPATPPASEVDGPPAEVLALVQQRHQARARRDWQTADTLRAALRTIGWQVRDTPDGPLVDPVPDRSDTTS